MGLCVVSFLLVFENNAFTLIGTKFCECLKLSLLMCYSDLFFFKILSIYLWLCRVFAIARGLSFSSCCEQGLFCLVLHVLLIATTPLVAEPGLLSAGSGVSACSARVGSQ